MFINKKNIIQFTFSGFSGDLTALPVNVIAELVKKAKKGHIICINGTDGNVFYYVYSEGALVELGAGGGSSTGIKQVAISLPYELFNVEFPWYFSWNAEGMYGDQAQYALYDYTEIAEQLTGAVAVSPIALIENGQTVSFANFDMTQPSLPWAHDIRTAYPTDQISNLPTDAHYLTDSIDVFHLSFLFAQGDYGLDLIKPEDADKIAVKE